MILYVYTDQWTSGNGERLFAPYYVLPRNLIVDSGRDRKVDAALVSCPPWLLHFQ
jgi:hypothetical protein